MRYDIVVVGGAIIGSSIAYHLARDGRAGAIAVIEPDPTYEWAATPRATGGVRQLFSLPENIRMSQASLAFYLDFATTMAVDGAPAEIDFRRQGYLFLTGGDDAAVLEANWRTQTALGARVELLDAAALKRRFPSLRVDDVALAALSPDDGWLDPYGALMGFRRKARSLGVAYLAERVAAIEAGRRSVERVRLASGGAIEASAVVIAAGAWSAEIAATAGMRLPVEPMSRMQHYFDVPAGIEPLPLIRDLAGLGMRPEGKGFIGGVADWSVPAGFDFEVDHGYFERTVWPRLAHRVPALETLKLGRTWRGHYARNTLDGNMIIGPWTGGLANLYVAVGFSGHGIMHAPAVGRAIAELVLDGGFRSLDLAPLSYRRVVEGKAYAEKGIK
ncbi:MAG: FAD-binding oxidoreductase [Proteobacteria bacterium]|nr:FAD-binding oxidoreductase [Pseudomonadota bacterium]